MKVYFTASTSYNGNLIPLYAHIVKLIEQSGATLTSGKQIITPRLLKKDKTLTAKEIYARETQCIDEADAVIAETSKPSLGVGSEIVYALNKDKPVLALIHINHEDKLSPILSGNPSDNLYKERYNEDNLKFKIKDFIRHIRSITKRKGKLIVIDGGDGSGKTTQAEILVSYLKSKKIPVKYMDFPQYYNSFHGKTVAKFLRGEFGKIDEVSPYLASLAYALDRLSVKKEMDEFLKKGGVIIANRYATSNMAHQAAKFKIDREREEYLKWVYELEYKVHKIPKEDLVIYLHVPWEIGLYLTKNKPIRHYLEGENADIHEKDLKYRQAVETMFLILTKKQKHWYKIECVEKNNLLSKEEIHKKILQLLHQKKIAL